MDNKVVGEETGQSAAIDEALVMRCATYLTPLDEDDDEFCSPECREAWWQEYQRSDVKVVALVRSVVMAEFSLRKRKANSFETNNPEAFCRWLGEQDFVYDDQIPATHEFARMKQAGQIAVVYDSGKVVCQGSQADLLVLLLNNVLEAHPWPVLVYHGHSTAGRSKRATLGR